MSKYINLDRVKEVFDYAENEFCECDYAVKNIREVVENLPAADVRPVVRGKWIKSKKHIWEKNEDGTVNEFAWGRGIHNGPFCTICGETPCVHCEPDYDEKDCEKEHYICPFCGRIEMDFQPFCNCGADMRDEEDNEHGKIRARS